MDNNSLQQIVSLAHQAKVDLSDQHIPALAISNSCDIKTLEHLLAAPKRYRAKLKTKFTKQFATYINANNGAKVFIDESRLEAESIFDMGDASNPEWGEHRAKLTLTKQQDYKAVTSNNASRMSQADFIDFIEDWENNIQFYSDGEEIHTKDAVNRIRRIKITGNAESSSNHGDFARSRSALESVEVASDGNSLPDGFTFDCNPYVDMKIRTIYCKLRAHTSDGGIRLSYRITGLSQLEEQLTEEFCDLISEGLDDKSTVTIGSIDYQ